MHIIKEYEPKTFNTIIDAFGGGGSVALYYLQNTDKNIIYNDLDKKMTKLFEILKNKNKTIKLVNNLHSIPFNKSSYEKLIKESNDDLIAFLYCSRTSFRGMVTKLFDVSRKNKPTYDNLLDFPDVLNTKRFKVTNFNAIDMIDKYKKNNYVFIYLDPPYLQHGVSNSSYQHTSILDLEKILKHFESTDTKCKIMLHSDFNGYTFNIFGKYMKHNYSSLYNSSNNKKSYDRYQMICTNY
jgi:site-specific DNA-adenine methylase